VYQRPTSAVAKRFYLLAPWQPISINSNIHINQMFVINIFAVLLNLYLVIVNE
jgi:hypothetical protein